VPLASRPAAGAASPSARRRAVPPRLAALALAALCALAPHAGAQKRDAPRSRGERVTVVRAQHLMGAELVATVEAVDSARAVAALEAGFAEIARLEQVLSAALEGSEAARVNAAGAQVRVPLSKDLHAALARAIELARETDGAFDPTVGPLTRAWDARGEGRAPDADEIADARSRIGWPRLVVEPAGRTLWVQREGMELDLDGLARGWALERAEAVMRPLGVRRAKLDFGAEVLAWADERAFGIGVPHPLERGRPVVGLTLMNGAAATACGADAARASGARPARLVLDPRRGAPVGGAASVTVAGRSGARADALADALLVLGRDGAERWAREHPGDGVLWLEPEGAGVRAWRWNLPAARALPGAEVRWMN